MKAKFSLAICIVLLASLLCAVALPFAASTVAYAEESHDIYFIDPTAVAVVGNYLFVSDNVDDNTKGIVWRFTLNADGVPTAGKQTDIEGGRINGLSGSSISLSDQDNVIGSLYVIRKNEAILYDVASDGTLTANAKSYTNIKPTAEETLVDACVILYDNNGSVAYINLTDPLYVRDPNRNDFYQLNNGIINSQAMFYSKDNLYYLANGTLASLYIPTLKKQTVTINNLGDFKPRDGFEFTDTSNKTTLALYNDTQIVFLEQKGNAYEPYGTADTWDDITKLHPEVNDLRIIDVATTASTLYILDSNNQVYMYNKESASAKAVIATSGDNPVYIGSETVSQAIPTDITSFKLARSTGYPTNIVYRTTDENVSIPQVYKKYTDTFIILEYDGSHNCPYYYVLIGDQFGWVMKSDGVTVPENDDKISIISSNVNDNVELKAKLVTLGNVYIYSMPFDGDGSSTTVFTQSAQNMQEVKLLQTFKQVKETETIDWFLISFTRDNVETKGFVKKSDLGYFTVDQHSVIGSEVQRANLKINATLFEAVTVYATRDMEKGSELYNEKGEIVRLYSGDRVFLLGTSDDGLAAEICILHNDNTADYGWIEPSRLVNINAITANTIAGLSFLGGAILLAILLFVVFRIKKKRTV